MQEGGGEEGGASHTAVVRLRDIPKPTVVGPNSRNVQVVGPYHFGNELGRGFFGVVRKALNIETGDFVAVKTMRLAGFEEQVLLNVEREITTLRSLDHRHIVQYLKFIKEGSNLHIVLEYVENGSLRDILKRFGALPTTVVQLYARQLLEALQYLHGIGIVHRDIKASNVLINKDGHCKLADFGACFTDDSSSSAGLVSALGAPYWLAPEAAAGGEVEHPSAMDIWSFGCTLYELLTGNPPWGDLQPLQALFKLHSEPFPELPADVECTTELRDMIKRCCAPNPQDRPSARALLAHPFITQGIETPRMKRMKTAKDLRTLLEEANMKEQEMKAAGMVHHRETLFVDARTMVNRGMPKWRPAIIAQDDTADGSLAKDVQRLTNQILVQEKDLFSVRDVLPPPVDVPASQASTEAPIDTTAEDSDQAAVDGDQATATEPKTIALRKQVAELEERLCAATAAHKQTLASAKETLSLVDALQQARKASFLVAEEYKNIAEEAVMDRKMVLLKLKRVEEKWSPSESFNQLQEKMRVQQKQLASYRILEDQLPDEQLALLVFGSLSVEHLRSFLPEQEGWMQKRSIKAETNESRKNRWKSRYFILKANFLFYFKGDKDLSPVGLIHLDKYSVCKGAVAGMQDRGVLQVHKGKSPEMFFSLTNRQVTYVMEADSKEARETWVRLVKQRVSWAAHANLISAAHAGSVASPQSARSSRKSS